ncbi:MAG TPA: hypothetical protein VFH57_07285 [Gammaproteobacteria bacterium]|nr:hypothetical protein [Gammaproteobacteria bacterium]
MTTIGGAISGAGDNAGSSAEAVEQKISAAALQPKRRVFIAYSPDAGAPAGVVTVTFTGIRRKGKR